MASELLANWLNNEIELSKVILDSPCFFTDFNLNRKWKTLRKTLLMGFYLESFSTSLINNPIFKISLRGTLRIINNFNRDTVASKLENFEMLEPTFRNLKIKFDSKMVDKIMK